jgi:hypothetical protein
MLIHGISRRFRSRRMRTFVKRLGITPDTRVLDVGGTWYNWALSPVQPRLTIVNLDQRHPDAPEDVTWLASDALAMPFKPGAFDVIFCNSLIEHVGDFDAQRRLADGIRRLECPYWVQTPNYTFPIEPHFLGLGIQFLPRRIARPYARYLSLWGWKHRAPNAVTDAMLDEIRLLTEAEVRVLFPEAEIIHERVGPFTKSFVAVYAHYIADSPHKGAREHSIA